MCGIAGFIGRGDVPDRQVADALSKMRRRGPDNAQHRRWTTPAGLNALFLHARLNIIDLDPRSNQPFRAGDKWMAYNGELYNYVEIRQSLERSGAEFTTESDTEV